MSNDRYFGLHFDFHAKKDQKYIGRYFDISLFRRLLTEARVDFLQCDTKGHEGISSYPTSAGTPAPEIEKDILREIREVTNEFGVDLYAHHSGAWDKEACLTEPSWAVLKEDGSPSEICSCFSPYYIKRLVPQINEIAEYGLDGIWIDGECWAMIPDHSDHAKKAYMDKYGKQIPSANDGDYPVFIEFIRQGFRDYVKNYVNEVKKNHKRFKITSNWYHTSFIPEKYDGTLDFISGDYEPVDSVNAARYEGRIIAPMGADWDLMSWAFTPQNGVLTRKSSIQLKQEAAVCISLGGGVQLYNIQYEGSIQDFMIPVCAEVSEFVQERKKYCYKSEIIPQICVFYSAEAYYSNTEMVFSRWINKDLLEMKGILLSLLDSGLCAEIAVTDNLAGNTRRFPLIVVPNFKSIENHIKIELLEYAQKGGNLILAGPDITAFFSDELPFDDWGEITESPIYLRSKDGLDGLNTRFMKIYDHDSQCIMYDRNIINENTQTYASMRSFDFGYGKICTMFYESGRQYLDYRVPAIKENICNASTSMFTPIIKLEEPKPVDIVPVTKDEKTIIHLTNLCGDHSNEKIRFIENIPSVKNINILYTFPEKVSRVIRMPENEELNFTETPSGYKIHIEELAIHSSIIIEK